MPARIVDERHVRESPADIDPDPPGHAAFAPLGGGFIVDWPFAIAEGLSSIWTASSGRPGTTVCAHDSYPPPPDRSFLPRCRERPGRHHPRRRGQGLHRRLERRGGVLSRSFASGCVGSNAPAARQASICAYELFHDGGCGGIGRRSRRSRPARRRPRLFRQRRLRGDRGRAQTRAPIFRRTRRAAAAIHHRATPKLSRHHARCARDRRPRVAAQAIRSASDRNASRVAGLRISRAPRGREPASLRRAAGARARTQDRGARRRERHRLCRRDGRRRHLGRGPRGAGLLSARARHLPPPRRAAHSRRGDVRHGPHGHAACLRAGGGEPGSNGAREGPRWRLHADRRPDDAERNFRHHRRGLARVPAQSHLYGSPARLRRGLGGPGGDTPRQPAGQRALAGGTPRAPAQGTVRQSSLRRRRARTRSVPGGRARRRSRHQGTIRLETEDARARQARSDGPRAAGLSHGRHGGRGARRSHLDCAAVHHRCCHHRHDRGTPRRGNRRGDGPNAMSRWSRDMRGQRERRSVMKTAIGIIVTAALLAGVSVPARTQNLEGTLKKVKETGTITIGHRDSSIPLSYLDDKLQPIGFSIELCKHVVDAVKAKLDMPNLSVKYNPVTSATRLPLVANGTVDIECGSTANMTSRQAQVGFSYTFFVPQFKWITRTNTGIKSADELRGKPVAVTAGTNTALFVNKMNNEGKLGMTIMQGKDHAESFLLVETGRASAWMEDDILIAGFRANAKNPADFKLLDQSYPSDPYALMIRKDDRQFKALVDETLANLMRSGEFETLYTQWFEKPIPPRAINIQLPMSDALKRAVKEPNDKPNS